MKATNAMLRLMAGDPTYNRLVCEAIRAISDAEHAKRQLTLYRRDVLIDSPRVPTPHKVKPVVVYPKSGENTPRSNDT